MQALTDLSAEVAAIPWLLGLLEASLAIRGLLQAALALIAVFDPKHGAAAERVLRQLSSPKLSRRPKD